MVDAYVDYTYTGETGDNAIVHHPNDPYFRYYTGGYGLSQAYGCHKLRGRGTASMSWREVYRLIGENLNSTERFNIRVEPNSWYSHFQPAYEARKAEYADANTFVPDVNWPLDPDTGWFRPTSDPNYDINDTTLTVTWDTDANSDSEVILTNNFPYSQTCWGDAQGWWTDGYDADACSATLVTSHSVGIPRTDLVPGDSYEYRIRSATDANVPDQIVYHHRSGIDDPNIDDPNIVAHWKFEENDANTTAEDSAGDNDGTISGGAARSDTGIVGTGGDASKALNFDGTDDYVQISDDDSISLGDHNYTIAAWINPDSTSSRRPIAVKTKDANDTEYGFSVILGKLKLDVEKDDNNQYATTTSNVVGTGSWQHVAVTFDASTTTPIFYHNGVSKSSTNTIDTLPDELSDGLYIGTYGAAGTYFDGTIDDVRLFNRVLASGEVDQLYYRDSAFWPTPADGAVDIDPNASLYVKWRVGTTVNWEDPNHFKRYFGTTDPPLYRNDTAATVWRVAKPENPLDPNETYYWRIDTMKANNEVVTGRVWSFKTKP
jgi:hypothetical protein